MKRVLSDLTPGKGGLGLVLAGVIAAFSVEPAAAQSDPASPKMEDVYKNVQVFKGQPAEQMLITMRFFRAALGVACTYCHVEPDETRIGPDAKLNPDTIKNAGHVLPGWFADEPAREVDTPRKQVARMMVRMTAAINKENFGGGTEITCFTCHRGSLRPASDYSAALVSPPNRA